MWFWVSVWKVKRIVQVPRRTSPCQSWNGRWEWTRLRQFRQLCNTPDSKVRQTLQRFKFSNHLNVFFKKMETIENDGFSVRYRVSFSPIHDLILVHPFLVALSCSCSVSSLPSLLVFSLTLVISKCSRLHWNGMLTSYPPQTTPNMLNESVQNWLIVH